jgi:anaerobic magnesium-protoporphyrin IX monomethyl ester cyclase
MKNKIILINPYADYATGTNKATVEPPLGLAYLSAIAKRNGYDCAIIDAEIQGLLSDRVIGAIDFENVLFVGISANVVSFRAAVTLARALKFKSPALPVVAGGPHISALPEFCLRTMGADVAVIGEGEETLLELLGHYAGKIGRAHV